MSGKKSKENKKRLAHEREDEPKFAEQHQLIKRAKTDNTLGVIKNTPSFGMDKQSTSQQSETADFKGQPDKNIDENLLADLIAPEELNGQKKKKYEGKFEELSDQFRQRGITKEMRTIIDNFASTKSQVNYKQTDLSDNAKRKKIAVIIREQFQVLMQDEVDFEKMKHLISRMQNTQTSEYTQQQEQLDIFIGAYFIKYSHSLEKGIVKKTQKDRETEFNAIRCFLRSKVESWDEKVKSWFVAQNENILEFLGEVNKLGITKQPQQNAQLFKAAKPDHKFKLPEKPDVETCIQIILKDVNNSKETVNGGERSHLYPQNRSRAAVRPNPSATWSTPQLSLENLFNMLNHDPENDTNQDHQMQKTMSADHIATNQNLLSSNKMTSEYEVAMRQQKQTEFAVPVPDKFQKEESSQSLAAALRTPHADKNAFFPSKLTTPGDRPTDRNSFRNLFAATREENKQTRSPLGGITDQDTFKHPQLRASPRHSGVKVPLGMQRGISETSFNFPPFQGLNTTPNRIQNDFSFKLGQDSGSMLGLPRVPEGLVQAHSNFSTTSLDKQVKDVDQRRGQFTSTGTGRGNTGAFGDFALHNFLDNDNQMKLQEYGNEFPLLAKDNSASDFAHLQVPQKINTENKDLSGRTNQSKKSDFSLGFSKNV